MNESSTEFMQTAFKEYYFREASNIPTPSRIAEREFGYMQFRGGMVRHLSFTTQAEVAATLVKEAPLGAYQSCGYYDEPTLPMKEKGWKGADLIFDIDAGSLQLKCKAQHDQWRCRQCGFNAPGVRPQRCPTCQSSRLASIEWGCETCLGATKIQALKLAKMLTEDFGVAHHELTTYFSGNLGYHTSVESEALRDLTQAARGDIVDYLRGNGLTPESLGISKGSTFELLKKSVPSPSEPGWRGRVTRYLSNQVEGGSPDSAAGLYRLYSQVKYRGIKRKLADAASKLGVILDPAVTTDIHRIFRMPLTLHGETGMIKKDVSSLEDFNPFNDAIAFNQEPVKVNVSRSPKVVMGEVSYGPFKDGVIQLPKVVAVYLIGKGVAEVELN